LVWIASKLGGPVGRFGGLGVVVAGSNHKNPAWEFADASVWAGYISTSHSTTEPNTKAWDDATRMYAHAHWDLANMLLQKSYFDLH
jgi:hypothetical protein